MSHTPLAKSSDDAVSAHHVQVKTNKTTCIFQDDRACKNTSNSSSNTKPVIIYHYK